MKKNIDFCDDVADTSNYFEVCNTELKRQYIIKNIELFNTISQEISGCQGTFGTGYPFYALGENLEGTLPVIEEQIRYNNELYYAAESSKHRYWNCAQCLNTKGQFMPDLKIICKPCPNMDNELKPRKIINRLPDLDMWFVCKENQADKVKVELATLFQQVGLYTSDIDPLKTITDFKEITNDLLADKIPKKYLPIDAHIIEEEALYNLISVVPDELKNFDKESNIIPYLPINPLSYRKKWQHDDEAYNFIHDYLSSLTEYNFNNGLRDKLIETRDIIINSHSVEELYEILIASGPESVSRRHNTLALKRVFEGRVSSWKR